MTGSGLPGAAASPLAERSNLLLSPTDHTKHRRPAPLLSPLGDQQPQLPQLLDGGGSPTKPIGSSGRYGEPRRESLGSLRTSASLTKQHPTAWASSRDLSQLGAGGHPVITAKGSLVVTIRTSHASAATPSPGTDGRVWCTLYGAHVKGDEVELPRHSRHDFSAGHVGKFPTKVNIAQVRVCVSHCVLAQPFPHPTLMRPRG